jgi:putative colanic acid biosynthesis glycosyltransferase WcaI
MATAQQLTSLASGLRDRGHDVTVLTGNRGYDDPIKRFAERETWNGIKIIRIPSVGLGKSTRWRRSANFLSFLLACTLKLMQLPRFDCVVGLTSPPMISFIGALYVQLTGGKFFFWVMDLNPDEAIAAGWLKPNSITTRCLDRLLRYSLRHSERVIVLDRFMKQRVMDKGVSAERIAVISPWAFDEVVAHDAKGREEFRLQYNLANNFVVMYAGNHSPCHPLSTLLQAASLLQERDDIRFCFMGGGSEQAKVMTYAAEHGLRNVVCLPYQPSEQLAGALSAADLHVAIMGDAFVGIVHPCKIYNILAVHAPVLYIGPTESPIAEIISELESSYGVYRARHGAADDVVGHILTAASLRTTQSSYPLSSVRSFSKETLLPKLIEVLEAKDNGAAREVVDRVFASERN